MKIRGPICAALLCVSTAPVAEEQAGLLEALHLAQVAGMCGALKQLARFQDAAKLEGGNEFIERFVAAEAERLGTDLPNFLHNCRSAAARFDQMVTGMAAE